MIMAALAAMSATAFAQDDLVKQAKKLCDKGELEQAVTTITPALTSAQTEDKAEAWNVMSEIQYQIGGFQERRHSCMESGRWRKADL